MTWLVTGGAGYIGSHVVRAFTDAGIGVVVLDSLESGHREFVPADVPFVEGDDGFAGRPHGGHHVRADVAGAAGHEPGHASRVRAPREGTRR